MKFRTTAKELKNGYCNIISVGYCELQSLLCYEYPVAYNRGTYGWNFDVYDVDGVAICTGYRPISSKNANVDYETVRKYKKLSAGKTREEKRELLKRFIDECVGGKK